MCEKKHQKKVNHNPEKIRILAFSDFHVQSLSSLVEFVNSSTPKPDLIFYVGDAINRFVNLPEYLLLNILKDNLEELKRLENVTFSLPMVANNQSQGPSQSASLSNPILFHFTNRKNGNYSRKEIIEYLSNCISDMSGENIAVKGNYVSVEKQIIRRITNNIIEENDNGKISPSIISDFLNNQVILLNEENEMIMGLIYFPNRNNYFHQLARLSKFGLCFVLGNDDHWIYNEINWTEHIFNVHMNPLTLQDFVIIGQEGAPYEENGYEQIMPIGLCRGYICYTQKEIQDHLEENSKKFMDYKQILISHCPPFGALDNAQRFGDRNIGSKAVTNFIKNNKPVLVLCGHVHRCGGQITDLGGTQIINAASHDFDMAKGNICIIDIKGNDIDVKWITIPSNFELLVDNCSDENLHDELIKLGFIYSERESDIIFNAIQSHGKEFVSNLPNMYWNIKVRYGFSLFHLVEMYSTGIRRPEEITREHIETISTKIKNGLSRNNFRKAALKLFALRTNGIVIFDKFSNSGFNNRRAYLDTEYDNSKNVVLYGFLVDNEFRQFKIGEESEVISFVRSLISKNYKVYFYGGADRKAILNIFKNENINEKFIKAQFFNVNSFIQTRVGLPIESKNLNDVAQYFIGSEMESVKIKLQSEDGMIKSMICGQIFQSFEKSENLEEIEAFIRMKELNKSDLKALEYIVEKLMELMSKSFI